MSVSFQNGDNFIRNLVTLDASGATIQRAAPVLKRTFGGLPVSIEDIANDIRLDSDDDAKNILRLARGAAGFMERRSAYVMVPTEYTLKIPGWPCSPFVVTRGPLREITSVRYRTGPALYSTVDPDEYFTTQISDREFMISFLSTFDQPDLWAEQYEVEIKFTAGFESTDEESGSDASLVECYDELKTIFIALIAHYYKYRELFDAGKVEAVEMGAGNLLNSIRMFW